MLVFVERPNNFESLALSSETTPAKTIHSRMLTDVPWLFRYFLISCVNTKVVFCLSQPFSLVQAPTILLRPLLPGFTRRSASSEWAGHIILVFWLAPIMSPARACGVGNGDKPGWTVYFLGKGYRKSLNFRWANHLNKNFGIFSSRC